MKRLLLSGFILLILILDWAALDDITTGKEPDYFGEYLTLALSLLIFTFLGFIFVARKKLLKER